MNITITCAACSSKIRATEKHRGKSFACPNCRSPVTVPADASPGVPSVAGERQSVNRGPVDPAGGADPLFGLAGAGGGGLDDLVQMEQTASTAIGVDEASTRDGDEVEERIASFMGQKVSASVSVPAGDLKRIRVGLRVLLFTAVIQLAVIVIASLAGGAMYGAAHALALEAATAPVAAMERELTGGDAPQGPPTMAVVAGALVIVAVVLLIIAGSLYLVIVPVDSIGTFYCLWLPKERSCRKLMRASLIVKLVMPSIVAASLALALLLPLLVYGSLLLAMGGFAAAWTLSMLALTNFAKHLERSDLADEGAQLMITGLALIAAGIIIPSSLAALVLMGQWTMLIVLFVCASVAAGMLFRQFPGEFLYYSFMYGTGFGFVQRYANFLSSLQRVRTKVT